MTFINIKLTFINVNLTLIQIKKKSPHPARVMQDVGIVVSGYSDALAMMMLGHLRFLFSFFICVFYLRFFAAVSFYELQRLLHDVVVLVDDAEILAHVPQVACHERLELQA